MLGCQQLSETVEGPLTETERSNVEVFELSLNISFGDELRHLARANRALGIEIYDVESGLLERREWLDYEILSLQSQLEGDRGELMISPIQPLSLSLGVYRIYLFLRGEEENLIERSGTPLSISCPQPFTLRSPLTERDLDMASTSWTGRVQGDKELTLLFTNRTCGPGELSTSLKGELILPFHEDQSTMKGLMLHLSPRDNAESIAPLTIPLSRYIRQIDDERYEYSVNQLPSGSFDLQLFVDSDGDSLPSPCDMSSRSGGDLWASEDLAEVSLQRGEQLSIEAPITVSSVMECDEIRRIEERSGQSIVYQGQLDLNELLRTAIRFSPDGQVFFSEQRRSLPPYRFLYGTPLFNLQEAIIAEGRFTVYLEPMADPSTEEVMTELAMWVDEGSDRILTPCDDLADLGVDLWWWTGSRARLRPLSLMGEESNLITPELITVSRRCDSPESLLEIDFQLNFMWPELSSSRPLILVYEDLLSGQIYQSTLRDIAPLDISSPLKVSRRLPAGAYLLSAYIDQDLNSLFTPCTEQSLGDRFSSSRSTIVSLDLGEIGEVSLSVIPRDCPGESIYTHHHFDLSFNR